jgi:hypothetical protein
MDRKQWRKRLLSAGLNEEVVDSLLAKTKDEDLVRMKDMSGEEVIEALKEVILKAETEAESAKGDETEVKKEGTADSESDEDEDEEEEDDEEVAKLKDTMDMLAVSIVAQVKDVIAVQEVEVEVPELAALVADVSELKDTMGEVQAVLKDLAVIMKDASQDESTVLASMVENLSPAQISRLSKDIGASQSLERVVRYKEQRKQAKTLPEMAASAGDTFVSGTGIVDAEGNEYANLSAMAAGTPQGVA